MDLIKVIDGLQGVGGIGLLKTLVYLYVGAKGIQEACKWISSQLNNYHTRKENDEKDQETLSTVFKNNKKFKEDIEILQEQVDKLQSADDAQNERLDKIIESIKNLSDMITLNNRETREAEVATIRAQLLTLSDKAEKEQTITLADLETFDDLQQLYLRKGGNSHFKHSIIPTYFSYPVRDLNGNIASEVIERIRQDCEV